MAHKSKPGDGTHGCGTKSCGGSVLVSFEGQKELKAVTDGNAPDLLSEIGDTFKAFRDVRSAMTED